MGIIRLARARTEMLPRVQLPTDSCRILLQVSYGCLWLPTVAYRSSNSCTNVGWHLTPRVYITNCILVMSLLKARVDGLHVLRRPRPSCFFFYDPSLEGTLIMVGKSVMPCIHKHS